LNLEDIDEQELTIAQYSCLLGWNTVLRALVNEFNLNLDDMQAALSDYSVLGGFEDNIAYLLQYRNSMLCFLVLVFISVSCFILVFIFIHF
jgi:hypothetical protein